MSMETLRQLLRFFANDNRRRILIQLARSPMNQEMLAKACHVPKSTVGYHLNQLAKRGYVVVNRRSRPNTYRIGKNITVLFGPTQAQLTVTAPNRTQFTVVTSLRN